MQVLCYGKTKWKSNYSPTSVTPIYVNVLCLEFNSGKRLWPPKPQLRLKVRIDVYTKYAFLKVNLLVSVGACRGWYFLGNTPPPLSLSKRHWFLSYHACREGEARVIMAKILPRPLSPVSRGNSFSGRFISYRKYILQITQPSQYRCTLLQYRFAVISETPSIFFFWKIFHQYFLKLFFLYLFMIFTRYW